MFDKAIEICKAVRHCKGTALFAGGWVRDKIMKRPCSDIDIEVFGLERETLEAILSSFGEVKLVGKAYGVYKVDNIDVTMPRREKQVGQKHTDLEVTVDKNMSFYDATLRRDLCINAMLFDPLEEKLYDYHHGEHQIKTKLLLHVDNKTFIEDPLRILRVGRFVATLGFKVAPTLISLCYGNIHKLYSLPKERIFSETEKALMDGIKPSDYFTFLDHIGAMHILFPELLDLFGINQGNTHHTEGDALTHSLLAIDVLKPEERELDVMFATLFHDLGKVSTRSEDDKGVHFYGHHLEGIPLYASAMDRLTNDVVLAESVINLAKHHMDVWPLIEHCKKKTIRKLASKTDIYKLLKVHKGDRLGRGTPASIDHIERIISVYEEVKDEIKPLVLGRHLIELGATPGKHFSAILNEIWEAQLDGKFNTPEGGLEYARTKI